MCVWVCVCSEWELCFKNPPCVGPDLIYFAFVERLWGCPDGRLLLFPCLPIKLERKHVNEWLQVFFLMVDAKEASIVRFFYSFCLWPVFLVKNCLFQADGTRTRRLYKGKKSAGRQCNAVKKVKNFPFLFSNFLFDVMFNGFFVVS